MQESSASSSGPGSGSGSGFSVNQVLLSGIAGKIGDAYDGLTIAISQFNSQVPDPADSLCSQIAGEWQKWHPAFDQELGALKEALGQMISKILSAGSGYQATEAANQSAAQSVGATQ